MSPRRSHPVEATRLHIERFDGASVEAGSAAAETALEACRAIREEVFVRGQGVPGELEWDGLDAQCEHFLLLAEVDPPTERPPARIPIGTARLRRFESGVPADPAGRPAAAAKAERVAVLEPWRGGGAGRRLMQALEARARALGLGEVRLNAQLPVVPFYERLGYRAHGEVFPEAGIAHRAMTHRLSEGEGDGEADADREPG